MNGKIYGALVYSSAAIGIDMNGRAGLWCSLAAINTDINECIHVGLSLELS